MRPSFFATQMPGKDFSNYRIRVNREPVVANYTLKEGDRVSFTPTKVDGATVEFVINSVG